VHGRQISDSTVEEQVGKLPPDVRNDGADFASLYFALLSGISIEKPEDVACYLHAHPELGRLVPAICARTLQEFGPQAQLGLKIYRDPEIDDCYLTLCVRLPTYDESISMRFDRVTQPLDEELCKVSGHLLVTTDFRAPSTIHGV
jgi:hypothetical protein